MSIFLNILFLLQFLFSILCQKISLNELKAIVSKNESKIWLETIQNFENSNNTYCRLCCIDIKTQTIGKHCGSHTLCKYPNSHPGEACKGFITLSFTRFNKETILDAHNTLRNIVASGFEKKGNPGPQPSSSNMRSLQWNEELALTAERWAAQCIFSHDVCRDLDKFPVGQIIAHGNFASNNELSYIKSWYDEVANFNKSEVNNFVLNSNDNHVTKRYTQLVWADTYQVGCARAVFQQSRGFDIVYREHFICNYGPSGNIPNQPVYKAGAPCSFCHEGTTCTLDYPSLCGSETSYKLNRLIDDKTHQKNPKVKGSTENTGCGIKLIKHLIFIKFLIINYN